MLYSFIFYASRIFYEFLSAESIKTHCIILPIETYLFRICIKMNRQHLWVFSITVIIQILFCVWNKGILKSNSQKRKKKPSFHSDFYRIMLDSVFWLNSIIHNNRINTLMYEHTSMSFPRKLISPIIELCAGIIPGQFLIFFRKGVNALYWAFEKLFLYTAIILGQIFQIG